MEPADTKNQSLKYVSLIPIYPLAPNNGTNPKEYIRHFLGFLQSRIFIQYGLREKAENGANTQNMANT